MRMRDITARHCTARVHSVAGGPAPVRAHHATVDCACVSLYRGHSLHLSATVSDSVYLCLSFNTQKVKIKGVLQWDRNMSGRMCEGLQVRIFHLEPSRILCEEVREAVMKTQSGSELKVKKKKKILKHWLQHNLLNYSNQCSNLRPVYTSASNLTHTSPKT